MRRILERHLIVMPTIAGLVIGLSAPSGGRAQTVMPPSAPANCVQNAGNGELACGSGATASPGTGATAVGINAQATADAAVAFGFFVKGASRHFCRALLLHSFVRPAPRAFFHPDRTLLAVARSGGQGRRFFSAAEGLSLTDASTAAGCP
jgi:hypothetical protein